jgi:hypothetical protein
MELQAAEGMGVGADTVPFLEVPRAMVAREVPRRSAAVAVAVAAARSRRVVEETGASAEVELAVAAVVVDLLRERMGMGEPGDLVVVVVALERRLTVWRELLEVGDLAAAAVVVVAENRQALFPSVAVAVWVVVVAAAG